MKNEATTGEMADIMAAYHRYVPARQDGSPVMVPLFCDGLSCERGHDAQMSRCHAQSSWDRLEGLEPAIQEWHRRQLQIIVRHELPPPLSTTTNKIRDLK